MTCMSSYEVAFVEWCAETHTDFKWQIPHEMPDGRTYVVDAYIVDGDFADTWIELKGWMRDTAKEKWAWFGTKHLNSELWTRDRLKSLGIMEHRKGRLVPVYGGRRAC